MPILLSSSWVQFCLKSVLSKNFSSAQFLSQLSSSHLCSSHPSPSVLTLCPQPLNIIQHTWSHVKSSSKVHTENQIINWNRSLQQRMFTCIFIRSNYLAKHPSPVSAPQVHWRFKTITKLLVKFCIDKPSQYFIFCPSTYNKSLVPFLWPLVNCFTTSWNVLWVGESLVTI